MEETLKKFFGFDAFRDGQKKLVEAAMAGKDSITIMATGSGKSVCYQLPALLQNKVVIVVSPLVSLMTDQVVKLNETVGSLFARERGSKEVAVIAGGSTGKSDADVANMVRQGVCRFVYMTPEKLQTSGSQLLASLADRIALVAIDEAHCVSEWGHDFRPDYRFVGSIRSSLPHAPIMALTATATPQVRQDIIGTLGLRDPVLHVGDFFRPNLRFHALPRRGMSDLNLLVDKLNADPVATIIYCQSRNEVESVKQYLEGQLTNQTVLQYHAGMADSLRTKAHLSFLTGKMEGMPAWVIVATIAFGMGIDKPDIRQIVHLGPPRTIEAYYQQAGRAGRDGLPSICVVHYSANDFVTFTTSNFYAPKNPDGSINRVQKEALDKSTMAMRAMCENDTCRQQAIVCYLEQEQIRRKCGICDNCNKPQDEKEDFGELARIILKAVQRGSGKAKGGHLDFLMGTQEQKLRANRHLNGNDEHFGSWKKAGMSRDVLKQFIELLCRDGFLSVQTCSFTKSDGYQTGYETLSVAPKSVDFSGPWICNAPTLLVEERVKKAERCLKAQEELRGTYHSVPADELANGDGPMLKVERDWNALLTRLQTKDKEDSGTRAQIAMGLLTAIGNWVSEEATRLQLAPHSILSITVAKKVAYVAYSSEVSTDALHAVGLRAGDIPRLVEIINTVRPKRMREGDEILFVPANWKPVGAVPGAPKLSPTVLESVELFCQGMDTTAVGMKREKVIAASTVENHLMTALLNGFPKIFPCLPRIWALCPTKSEILRIENAMQVVGVSLAEINKAKADIVRAIDGDSAWYPKLSWLHALHQLGVPYTFQLAENENAEKRQKVA